MAKERDKIQCELCRQWVIAEADNFSAFGMQSVGSWNATALWEEVMSDCICSPCQRDYEKLKSGQLLYLPLAMRRAYKAGVKNTEQRYKAAERAREEAIVVALSGAQEDKENDK